MFDNILEWLDCHSTDLIWNEFEGIAPSVLLYLKSVVLFFVSFYDATFLCRNVTWDLQKKKIPKVWIVLGDVKMPFL